MTRNVLTLLIKYYTNLGLYKYLPHHYVDPRFVHDKSCQTHQHSVGIDSVKNLNQKYPLSSTAQCKQYAQHLVLEKNTVSDTSHYLLPTGGGTNVTSQMRDAWLPDQEAKDDSVLL